MYEGRVILITGTSRGIGRYLTEYYLQKGALVIGCSRSDSPLSHERYSHFGVDVTDEEAVKAMFSKIRKEIGKLDALINNAGIASMNPVILTPLSSAKKVLETNFLGPFVFIQMGVRLLRKAEAARIVNVSSVAVPLRLPGEAVYAASKAAIEVFTRIVAKEVASFGITCNAVGPGPINTDLIKGVKKEKIDELTEKQAIKKLSEPTDVANVIDFFLKPESAMITGQVIYLGGVG